MAEKRSKIYIGCSGWSYSHWRGCFYPQEWKSYEMLDYYLKHFNSVEVNSTFYHYPKIATIKRWAEKCSQNFRFTIKANRLITHKKKLVDIQAPWRSFWAILKPLVEKKKLGAVLFQFPITFTLNFKVLQDLLNLLPGEYFDFSFEFRHVSWYCQKVFSLLKGNNCDFVSLSWPKGEPFNEVLSRHKYFRFHGAKRMIHYDYNRVELEKWADTIQEVLDKTERIYIYFNNDPQCNAPKNAKTLRKILESRGILEPYTIKKGE